MVFRPIPIVGEVFPAGPPEETELFLCFSAPQPINLMSIDLVRLGWILLFTTPSAVELSVRMGVRVCGCPISVSIFLMYTASFALTNSAPSSAFAADDMTALIIWAMLRMAPLLGGEVFVG